MGLLIRFVACRDFVDSNKWNDEGSVPDGALRHFVDDPALSIYSIPSTVDIPRTIAAFALGNREGLRSNGLLIVSDDYVDVSQIEKRQSDGDVPDPVVKKWHWELLDLTPMEARKLAFAFGKHGKCRPVSLGKIKSLVRMASDNEYFCPAEISAAVSEDLERVLKTGSSERCSACDHRKEVHDRAAQSRCILSCMICELSQ